MGRVKLGTASLNGTKIKANVNKYKVLNWEHANRLKGQLEQEVGDRMGPAAAADPHSRPEKRNISEKLKRYKERPAALTHTQGPVNRTAEESCIMPSVNGGLEQADNAQAGVDVERHILSWNSPSPSAPMTRRKLSRAFPGDMRSTTLLLKERFTEDPEPPQNSRSVRRETSNADQGGKSALRKTQIHG